MMQDDYKINLAVFEGPLDLLLHLIKKDDLSIEDIPVSDILEQYFQYLDLMKELNIDLAGEFILMAAELALIKSKMLLFSKNEEEDEGPDPRADLVARLMEYQKYKMAAQWLDDQKILFRDVYKRSEIPMPDELKEEEGDLEIEPFNLISAFNKILKRTPKEGRAHEVEAERVSVTDRIYQIVEKLKLTDDSLAFETLFEEVQARSEVVLTFLAILEMARLKMIQIFQTDRFGQIRVRRRMEINEGLEDMQEEQVPETQTQESREESNDGKESN